MRIALLFRRLILRLAADHLAHAYTAGYIAGSHRAHQPEPQPVYEISLN